MKHMILICATLAFFVFGYCIMKKVDAFMAENQRAIEEENRRSRCLIRIAAETPMLVASVAPAMEYCSWVHPYIGFCVSGGRVKRMLQRLQDGTIDILLLTEASANDLHTEFASVKIPYRSGQVMCDETGLNTEGEPSLCVLWNQTITSPNRDRVVFVLCNDFCVS